MPGVQGIGCGSHNSPLRVASGWSCDALLAVAMKGSQPFLSEVVVCLSETPPELNVCGQTRVICKEFGTTPIFRIP